MAQYKVRSGQNIYDVAVTLYGSVEGIFDLLVSNPWLNMETRLTYGMTLSYHDGFIINKSIVEWLRDNNVLVKNGEYVHLPFDIEELVINHFQEHHTDFYNSLMELSADERNMYWDKLINPRMVIRQHGRVSNMTVILKPDTHIIVDWGDFDTPQIFEGTDEQDVEHCYKGDGEHIITIYGNCEFAKLDLRELNGIYYPITEIIADSFQSKLKIQDINKLIITL